MKESEMNEKYPCVNDISLRLSFHLNHL